MDNKIVLKVRKQRENTVGDTVRLSREAADAIEALILETGLSAKSIASSLILQAAQLVEIQEV